MATKIISASKILEAKGYKQPKFDQQGFNNLIASFFETHEVKDTLLIVPKRFADWPLADTTEDGYKGFVDFTPDDIWERQIENGTLDWVDYLVARNKGLTRPTVYVDEPFCKNAAYMLSVMGGFTVKKLPKGKHEVSLI